MAMMLRQKARVYAVLNDADQTETYYEKHIAMRDSITGINLESQLSEMRTKYDVDRHILEKTRNRNYAILAAALLAAALIALTVWILYSRRLTIKNRALVERIREQDKLHEQLQACSAARRRQGSGAGIARATPEATQQETENTLDCHGHSSRNDEPGTGDSSDARMEPGTGTLPASDELFDRIAQLVEQGRAFLDPTLNRNTLASLVGSNETYVRRSIQNNTGQTVNDYLNSLRLRYARELLANRKLTIEVVATEAGFGARNTFHNIFKKEYGLTPDEFRRFSS
ncbi:AraC family transcriptional regulator [Bacteroides sp. 51]|uniref:helix-turn-helix domain-containing protein n=1 Tax=Bacteroides sp. 51 TaxID=2302938 RepID=UPI0013D1C774|nr:AraC family transcriptional regulator [Bacteroides sp. 51]